MTYETVLYDVADRIATITLNRPNKRNAQSSQLLRELGHALDTAEQDDEVRVVILTGAGKAFCAGADLQDWADAPSFSHTVETWLEMFSRAQHDRYLRFWEMTTPTIAAVNGDAVGAGCDLVMCCDLAVMAEDARVGYSEIMTSSWGIAWLVGLRHLRELMLTGALVDGPEAYRMGLVNRVVPRDNLMDEARALAERIARVPRTGVTFNKRTVREIYELMGVRSALRSGLNNAVLQMLTEPAERVEKRRQQIHEKGLKQYLAEASSPILGET